jgi:hypothetical protein
MLSARDRPADAGRSLSRRTILTGSAWTIPAIAAASTVPAAAAASGELMLSFDRATYSVTACQALTGASISVIVGGLPAAGVTVTLSLGGGLTFANGSTTATLLSDSNGRVNISAITVPARGGTAVLTVTSGSAVANATVTAPPSAVAYSRDSRGENPRYPGVPGSAIPVGGWGYFLDGTNLYYGNDIIATGVTRVVGGSGNAVDYVTYISDGAAHSHDSRGTTLNFTSVPGTAVPVGGWGYFLDGTNLYWGDTIVATGVTRAIGGSENSTDYVTYMSNGVAYSRDSRGANPGYPSVPHTAVPVGGWGLFLDGTNLYYGNDIVATGVTSASGGSGNSVTYATYMQNGQARNFDTNGNTRLYSAVPSTAVPAGGWGYFLDGTTLYYGDSVIATGVLRAVGGTGNGTDYMTYMRGTC